MQLVSGVLNGYVDVKAHDKLWAKIHLGIINKHYTIFHAEACYKGRLSYNINIVKVRFPLIQSEDNMSMCITLSMCITPI